MAQHTGPQYDDDLTVGADDYNESFSTDYVDLFEPLGDEDSPIAKLKTIILSIDWEITDDILHQLNEELQDLKDIWAGDKINLIYIQALEKIGRYIFAEKANAHPNAIKLLLTFYYDLEKIVSSPSMDEEAKKQLLLQDVKKFEQFKLQIVPPSPREERPSAAEPLAAQKNVLSSLKAIVLGIDWEITDKELVSLDDEVDRLGKIFSESRAKQIFLQGIGALGNYIRSTKNNAHPDAFKLLHSFFDGLEKICSEDLSSAQEKEILLAEVNKFNEFKAVIAAVASEVVVPAEAPGAPAQECGIGLEEEEEDEEQGGVIAPAFADMPEDVHGFRVDAEVAKTDVDQRVDSFFGEEEVPPVQAATATAAEAEGSEEGAEVSSRLDALFGEIQEEEPLGPAGVAPDIALEGVHVETEADDESGEKALPFEGGEPAPALAEAGGRELGEDSLTAEIPPVETSAPAESVIPGVDVETEADDESEEPPLPREQGWVAPALMFSEEGYGFRETDFAGEGDEDNFDLEDRLDSFFGAEIEEAGQTAISEAGKSVLEKLPSAAPEVQAPAEAVAEELEVIFEPVGDEVEVDELPAAAARGEAAPSALEQEALAGIRHSLDSMLEKQYETALPAFWAETGRLRQAWQGQHVKTGFLQLLTTVCHYIEQSGADAESVALLQSLSGNLPLLSQGGSVPGDGKEKIFFTEMGKVLQWQQGLVLSGVADSGKKENQDVEKQVMNELTDLFGDE